jgi:predicted aspartyl protease
LVNKTTRPPLQCWGCKEPHLYKDCPLNKNINQIVHNIQEATTVNDMARCTHKINAALENRQVDHQSSMVEIEGMINRKPVSILIDPGASLSYISPTIVEGCKLDKIKHKKSWLVQLATGTKQKVVELVKYCTIIMDEMETKVDLNILPLGSYDLLIGMDWMEKHSTFVNCRDKTFNCLDESRKGRKIKGIPRGVSVRHISSLQLKGMQGKDVRYMLCTYLLSDCALITDNLIR